MPCSDQSTEFHICLTQANLNAIFIAALFPFLKTIFVHYNLSPIYTISCVSTMNNYNYIKLFQNSDSSTQSTITLLGDTFLNINTPILHENSFVALPNRTTNELSYFHLTQVNLDLQILKSSKLMISPFNDKLPSKQSTELIFRSVHHGLPTAESVLPRCEQYAPHIVLPMLTVIQ